MNGSGFGFGGDCLPTVRAGEHGIFYTTGDPEDALYLDRSELDLSREDATRRFLQGREAGEPDVLTRWRGG